MSLSGLVCLLTGQPYPVSLHPAQTHPLRQAILRPGQSTESLFYPGDDDPDTFHLGVRDNTGRIVSIASFYANPLPDAPPEHQGPAYRIRGMATDPAHRNQGLGRSLVQAGIARIKAEHPEPISLWCNARTTACGYYAKLGFTTRGDEFDIDGIGPHYVMMRVLDPRE